MNALKHIFFILILFVNIVVFSFAQAPQKVSYQMVVRDASGALVKESAVGVQISILQGSAEGTAVYAETHTTQSNVNGLVSIEVGNGTPVTNTFAGIDWTSDPYFLKVETDPVGGTNYSITATSEILSVPYALRAKTAKTAKTATGTLLQDITLLKNTVKAGGGLYDERDGNYYNTVKIGNQVWIAENLRYLPVVHRNSEFQTQANNKQPGYGVYGYNGSDVASAKSQANYATYGVLYNWYAVNSENVCPAGLHVPTDAEWTVLTDYLYNNAYGYEGSGDDIAKSLTTTSSWGTDSIPGTVGNNQSSNNSSGFTALPGGLRFSFGDFVSIGYNSHWWSATESGTDHAWYRCIYYDASYVYRNTAFKEMGYSVRCVWNDASPLPTVTTSEITNITHNTAISGGYIISDGGAPITARGVCWNTTGNPTIADNKTTDGTGTGNFSSSLTGLIPETPYYYVRAYATNSEGTAYGEEKQFSIYGTFTDSRDGHTYKTVQIGSQVWMAENLKYLPEVHSYAEFVTQNNSKLPGYGVYLYDGSDVATAKSQANYTTYGVLYNWYAVNSGTIAPTGWHVPTEAEWRELSNYLINNGYGYEGSGDDIAKSLASKTNWDSSDYEGTPGNAPENNNSTGFTALPGGYRYYVSGFFIYIGEYGFWWSSTKYNEDIAYSRSLYSYDKGLASYGSDKGHGFSVRLVRD